jgi:hypothetical protein
VKKFNFDQISYTSIPITMHFSETEQKLASGTAFIYEFEEKFYLITNWHNVTGLNPITKKYLGKHCGIPDVLNFKLQTQKEPIIKWETFTMNLYNENKANWFIHPVHKEFVDVVALEIEIPDNFNGVLRPINKIQFDDFNLRVADEVFILGFPYSITGGGSLPIWKRGSVATEPDIDYEDLPKFFIDTASKSGMSGSPVIFRRFGIHGAEDGTLRFNSRIGEIRGFVGIYSGRITGESEFDAQLGIVWKKEVIEEIIKGKIKDEKKNT